MLRSMDMRSLTVVCLAALLGVSGCTSGKRTADKQAVQPPASPSASPTTTAAVPPEFVAACGHPGSRVYMRTNRATIKRSDCDLRGVTILRSGHGGAKVPEPDRGVSNGNGFNISTSKGGTVSIIVSGAGGGNG